MASKNGESHVDTSEANPDQAKPEMSISQLLVMLKDQVVPGRGIPEQLDSPPWRIPSDAHPKSDLINAILDKSMECQSATVPKSDEFAEFIVSNASMAVCGLVRSYLHSVLGGEGKDDLSKVTAGIFLWDPTARESATDYEGSPYLWLDVLGKSECAKLEPLDRFWFYSFPLFRSSN